MNKQEVVGAFAVAALGLSLSTSIVMADGKGDGDQRANADPMPWTEPVPKANCGPGDRTESGLQGQTTPDERFSGDSEGGYNCNLELVGQFRGEGAWSQKGPAYSDDCAYYGTDSNPLQQHRGVVVVDASEPRHPRASAYLDDTPSMLDPHETLKQNERRKLLAGAQRDGPGFALYDLSADCRHPVLKSSIQLTGSRAHMGGFAPDGLTYYVGQSNRGIGGIMPVVDISDPSNPKHLLNWQFLGDGRPHDVNLSKDGTRLYAGQPGTFGNTGSSIGPNGLVILDVSDIQFRLPNPQVRIVSKLFWDDGGQAEQMLPITLRGRPYIISTDESGGQGGAGGLPAACARGAPPYGFAQIIDISDERNPKIVSKLMLEVSDPANCPLFINDPPENDGGRLDYSGERCTADRVSNATMLACGYRNAGVRVFDIRDPYRPKEIAYYKPPAMRTAFLPGSANWGPGVDRTVDRIAGLPRFRRVAPANEHAREMHGPQLEIWVTSDDNGFQIVRFTDTFKALHKDLFKDALSE
jgi:hypothetical protein